MPHRRSVQWLVLWVLCLVVRIQATSAADSLDVALETAANRLSAVAAIKGGKLGLGEFQMSDGRVVQFGVYLADKLDVALIQRAETSGFEVVNRSELCQVIRENGFWVQDRFDPALARKLGNMAGVQFLVTGRITDLDSHTDLILRVVSTESTRTVWGDSLRIPLDSGLRPLLNRGAVAGGCGQPSPPSPSSPPPDQQSLRVKLWTDTLQYRIGESVRFHLKTSRDAHITLVNIGTSGEVAILFPNRFHPSHFVKGEQEVAIPAADADFDLVIKGPPGFEQVRVIASEEPIKLHPDDFPGQKGAFRSLDQNESRVLTRDIKVQKARVPSSRWAEDVITLQVR